MHTLRLTTHKNYIGKRLFPRCSVTISGPEPEPELVLAVPRPPGLRLGKHEHTRQPSTLVSVSMRLDPYEVVHALGSVQIDRNAVVIEAPSKRRVGSGRGAAVTTG